MSPILSAVWAAAGLTEILKTLPRGNVLPQAEAQVRPLLRLPAPEQQVEVWAAAVEQADGGQPSAPQVKEPFAGVRVANTPLAQIPATLPLGRESSRPEAYFELEAARDPRSNRVDERDLSPPTPPDRRLGTPGSEKQFLSNFSASTGGERSVGVVLASRPGVSGYSGGC